MKNQIHLRVFQATVEVGMMENWKNIFLPSLKYYKMEVNTLVMIRMVSKNFD